MDRGRHLDALALVRAMVQPHLVPGSGQVLVSQVGPLRSDLFNQVAGSLPVIQGAGLRPEALGGHHPRAGQHMRVVIPGITAGKVILRAVLLMLVVGQVDRHVHRHAVPIREPLGELVNQLVALAGVQLVGQRHLVLAGRLRVLPRLGRLGCIPQLGTVAHPLRGTQGQDDLRVIDAAPRPVVMRLPGARVLKALAAPIGAGRDRASPGRARHRFDGQVVDRQRQFSGSRAQPWRTHCRRQC